MALSIAFVRQRFRGDGGAERILLRLLEGFGDGTALEPHIICRSWHGSGFDGHVEICDPPFRSRIGRERSFARAVQALLATAHFDLVQSHERIPGCTLYRAGDGVHRAWLTRYAATLSPLHRLGLRLSRFHRYLLRAERALFADTRLRAVICNSAMVRDELIAHYAVPPQKLHLIYNGVDTEVFHPRLRTGRSATRARLGIADTTPLLLFVGSGFHRKGLAAALRALAQTQRAELLVIGQDSHVRRYQSLARRLGIKARVHWLGVRDDVAAWYGAADGLLLPTLYDPFPNVILEAMACGLGVITSSACGGAEFISAGIEGHVCDAADIAGLAAAIADFEDPARARACGDAARRRVEPFTLTHMQQQLLDLYATLLPSTAEVAHG